MTPSRTVREQDIYSTCCHIRFELTKGVYNKTPLGYLSLNVIIRKPGLSEWHENRIHFRESLVLNQDQEVRRQAQRGPSLLHYWEPSRTV